MNKLILSQTESLTMGSKEISSLTGVRQDNVKRVMIALQEKGVISFTQNMYLVSKSMYSGILVNKLELI